MHRDHAGPPVVTTEAVSLSCDFCGDPLMDRETPRGQDHPVVGPVDWVRSYARRIKGWDRPRVRHAGIGPAVHQDRCYSCKVKAGRAAS